MKLVKGSISDYTSGELNFYGFKFWFLEQYILLYTYAALRTVFSISMLYLRQCNPYSVTTFMVT